MAGDFTGLFFYINIMAKSINFEHIGDFLIPRWRWLLYVNMSPDRFIILPGSRGSGKSVQMGHVYPYYTFSLPKHTKIAVGQKYYASIKNASYQNIKDRINTLGLTKYFVFRKSPYSIYNKLRDVEIIFIGLDNEDSLKSLEGVIYLWMEEADQLDIDQFGTINLTVRGKPGLNITPKIFMTFNPGDPYNYIKTDFIDNPERSNYIYMHSTYLDNPFIGDDFILEMDILRRTNYDLYKRDGLGLYVPHEGIIFKNWKEEYFDYSQVMTNMGRDFGFNDEDAFVETFMDLSGEIPILYICNEFTNTQKTNGQICELYKKTPMYKPNQLIKCEHNPDKVLEMTSIYGMRAVEADKSSILKKHQLEIMQTFDIRIHPQCTKTINEFKHYPWHKNKKTGQLTDEPEDGNDHHIDAIRYSIDKILINMCRNSIIKSKYLRGI